MSRKSRKGRHEEGKDEEDGLGGFGLETLKEAARGFCRLGSPFAAIYQLVTVAMKWDLARDARLRGQTSPLAPGYIPTEEELKAIEDVW